MTIAEKILRAKADYDAVYEAGKKSVGEVLKFTDVESTAYRSTVPNGVEPFARVNKIGGMSYKTKQLLPYPYYYQGETTLNGVTWNFTENGITASGTQTVGNSITLYSFSSPITLNGSYTASINTALPSGCTFYLTFDDNLGNVEFLQNNTFGTKTINNRKCTSIRLWIISNSVFNGENFKFMFNEGTTALPFEPYFEGLRSASVTELKSEGVNLFNYDNVYPDLKSGNNVINTVNEAYANDLFTNTNGSTAVVPLEYIDKLLYLTEGAYYSYFDMEFEGTGSKMLTLYKVDENSGQTTAKLWLTSGEVRFVKEGEAGYYTIRKENNIPSKISNFVISKTPQTQYIPYISDTLAVPEAVKSLEGYGLGKSLTEYNYIDFVNKKFKQDYARCRIPSNTGGYNSGNNWYWISVDKVGAGLMPISRSVLCDKIPYVNLYDNSGDGIGLSNDLKSLIIRNSNLASAEEYKQWFADNEVYIIERLAEPIETDISAYLTDEYIEVEGGGTITAVNEYGYDAPTNISYLIDTQGG